MEVRTPWPERKKGRFPVVFFCSAPIFLFFLLKSLHAKVQGNWAAASYVTAFLGAVWVFDDLYTNRDKKGKRKLKRWIYVSLSIGLILSGLTYFPWPLKSIGAKKFLDGPPFNRVTGWEELGNKVSRVLIEMERSHSGDIKGPKQDKVFIISDTYQLTSELAFYTTGKPVTYNVDIGGRRMNQYDLWPGFDNLIGFDAIFIRFGAVGIDPIVKAGFDNCSGEGFSTVTPDRKFSIFKCSNYKGIKKGGREWSY